MGERGRLLYESLKQGKQKRYTIGYSLSAIGWPGHGTLSYSVSHGAPRA